MSAGDEEEDRDSTKKLPKEGAAALTALRNLWGATGRERAFFSADGAGGAQGGGHGSMQGKSAMESVIGDVGFGGLETFAEDGEASNNTYEAGKRLSSAWKTTMEREGKLMHPGQSVSDLMAKQREAGVRGAAPKPGAEAPPKKSPFFADEEDLP